MKQHTISASYNFCGKGLHTGRFVQMTIKPAPIGHGIVFQRTDLGEDAFVEANIRNISHTDRSTSLKQGNAEVITTEHLLSAMIGLGVDNLLVQLNAPELPILDGSAKPYVDAVMKDGLVEQDAEREYFVVDRQFEYVEKDSDSKILVEPYNESDFAVEIDFNSKVLGLQIATYNASTTDYPSQIAPCRTFCFVHEIKPLIALGLIKGGDLSNAIIIDEPKGYLNDMKLRFPNECARHKLLDLIGDFALLGKPIKGKITAFKPGHKTNTNAVKALVARMK